jgi:cytoskeletal protein CcmA (bactofilin family)
MFLSTLIRRFRTRDDGVALAAVIGMMAVGLILTAVISTTVVSSVSFTSLTRAGVQSQSGAEAGIAAARAGLVAGDCAANGGVYENLPGEEPEFEATIWLQSAGGWTRGCPTNTSTEVRILSTGFATTGGVANAEGRDEAQLEAVLSSVTGTGGIFPSGPAIYAYNASGFGGSGTLLAVDGTSPSVLVKQGNVSCSGASGGDADWVIDNGNLSISGSCSIRGNAWASGSATLSGGVRVDDNLVANGITISGSSVVGGNAWSTSGITLSGGGTTIGGNATANALTMNSSTRISGNAWILTNTYMTWGSQINGRLTTQSRTGPSGSVGSLTLVPSGPGPSPYLTPPRPFVPDWVDYQFETALWPGFTIVSPTGNCNYSTFNSALATIGSGQGIIDARGCNNGEFNPGSWQKLNLQNDLAVIANRFNLGGSAGFTAGSDARLWLITPDVVDNGLPTCPSGASFNIGGSFTFSTPISTLIYTPCDANIASGLRIKGQLFAGEASVGGAAQISYDPIGIPGVDLSTGEESAGGTAESDRQVLWIRSVGDGG